MFRWTVQKVYNRGALRMCSGAWNSEDWQKLHWFIVFHISIWEAGGFVWEANHTKVPLGDETKSTAAQWWERAWDCSWNLWLKWIKAIQWRTQNIFTWRGFIQWHMVVIYVVCAVCDVTIWRHIHVSKPMFWRGLLT